MQEIVIAQKEGYRQVLENTKEIHTTTLKNQQNREYYSLRFSEVQKKLSGMEVELLNYHFGFTISNGFCPSNTALTLLAATRLQLSNDCLLT